MSWPRLVAQHSLLVQKMISASGFCQVVHHPASSQLPCRHVTHCQIPTITINLINKFVTLKGTRSPAVEGMTASTLTETCCHFYMNFEIWNFKSSLSESLAVSQPDKLPPMFPMSIAITGWNFVILSKWELARMLQLGSGKFGDTDCKITIFN